MPNKNKKPVKKEPSSFEKRFIIRNKLGLHARPAAMFVQTANQFKSDIEVSNGTQTVDGKSIMGIMMLAAGVNSSIQVKTTGPDAKAALAEMTKLIESNFGEE